MADVKDVELYLQIILQLKERGLVLTEHIGDARLDARGEHGLSNVEIHDRDLAWLRQAECLVAEVTTPQPRPWLRDWEGHGVGQISSLSLSNRE